MRKKVMTRLELEQAMTDMCVPMNSQVIVNVGQGADNISVESLIKCEKIVGWKKHKMATAVNDLKFKSLINYEKN
tara:strand:+ start:66 stop:290 length:225 start_codon:yes stop_codon:yes gene_type:complete